jgi:hypothetical protein
MQERKGTLPGIKNASKKKTSLEGIKNAENNRSSSALPIMQYFGKVQPSRRIVKADESARQQSTWQKPTISNILKPGFSGNMRTSYNPVYRTQAYKSRLDSYAGAAAAYSLRKLYSSYTGSAINVRRSSDNATQDIGFNGYVLDTDSLLSFVGAGSGYVTTWYDQSGNGVDMVQALAASQPTIVNTGSLVVDGSLPTIQFDGVDDVLTTNISLLVGDVIDIFGVHNGNDATSLIYHASGTGSRRWFMIGQSGSSSGIVSDYINITNSDVYKNGANSLTLINRDNWYTTFFNGVKNLSRILGTISFANWTQFSLNGYTGFQTQIKTTEVILYKSNQSTNRAAIESLINTYYGIY